MRVHLRWALGIGCVVLAMACGAGSGDNTLVESVGDSGADATTDIGRRDASPPDTAAHDAARDATGGDVPADATLHGCGLVTCATAHANCGPIGDGCNTVLSCGSCTAPQTCGGGGQPSQCGGSAGCVPRTCATAHADCGPVSDGCGGILNCGACAAPQTCGGGGQPSQCGVPSGSGGCTPRTCISAGANCGPVADGCGGILNCGACLPGQMCGGLTPSVCSGTSTGSCTGLCLMRPTCMPGATTTITGQVVTPAHTSPDPLYNAVVYIPNGPVAPFTPGVSCDRCGAPASGMPLVSATTGPNGIFELIDVPAGTNIPLVIQLGRWRRQVTIPVVNPCMNNPISTDLTRLPRNHTEGDIPLTAMVTGSADPLECVLRKIGIDDAEFTTPAGGGRIQFYVADGADAGPSTPTSDALYNNPATLARYDMVLFACEGMQNNKPMNGLANVVNYTSLGGRVFATHYSYTWLYTIAPFSGTAAWDVDQTFPADPLLGLINTSFPRGMAFSQWLVNVGASLIPGEISISSPRDDVDSVVAPTQPWITSVAPSTVQHLTFDTPVGVSPSAQCGRVLFSDFHVTALNALSGSNTFPAECDTNPLTAQEKVLEFMLFDLASCIAPDANPVDACTPLTCVTAGASCGPIGDGCGRMLSCGTCPAGTTCGGGGMPSVCGTPQCVPQTCAQQGFSCGPAGDGCGHEIQCGTCTAPETCGGGGHPGVCGRGVCTPRTCAQAGAQCGPIADGCGGVVQCGPCHEPTACGGGSIANRCGSPG